MKETYLISRLKLVSIIALVGILLYLYQVLVVIFIAFIFVTALLPIVNWLSRNFKLPRSISSIATVGFCLFLIGIVAYLTVNNIAKSFVSLPQNVQQGYQEFQEFLQTSPYVNQFADKWYQTVEQQLNQMLENIGSRLLTTGISIFETLVNVLIVIFLTIYSLIEWPKIVIYLKSFFPKNEQRFNQTLEAIQSKIGHWIRGQVADMVFVALFTYFGLSLIGIPNALALGVLAGTLELIPFIGPTTAAIPGILIALTISPGHALTTTIFYLILQQIESNFLLPVVMRKAVELSPVITIIAVLTSVRILGPLGAILAIPLTTIIHELLTEFREQKLRYQSPKSD